MADIRINSLPSTATSFNTDDYIAIDGASNGTRKMLAANPPFSDVTLGTSGPSVKSSLSARAPRQGLVFDGTAGATVASVPAFGTSNYSFAVWVVYKTSANPQALFDSGANGCVFSISASGQVLLYDRKASATRAASSTLLTAGKSYFLAYSRTGQIYINGVADGAVVADGSNYTDAIGFIGKSYANTEFCFGSISGALIYNRALSASEVVSLYEAGAPSGADYNSASNTALNVATFANSNIYPYGTFSGASTTGFTAVSNGTGFQAAFANTSITFKTGTKYRLTYTLTLNSGAAPFFVLGNPGVAGYSTAVQLSAGTNSVEVTATGSATSAQGFGFQHNSSAGNYAISNISLVPVGLLLAPDAAQAGGGLVWYDTSGNAANISWTSGVSWNVPTAGRGIFAAGTNAAPSISFANDPDTGFYNPAANEIGISVAGVKVGVLAKSANDLRLYGGSVLNYFSLGSAGDISLTAAGTNQNITLTPSGTGNVVADAGFILNRVNAKGIYTGTSDNCGFTWTGTNGEFSTASGSLILKSAGTTALTLDSSQNATFAGKMGIGGASVAASSLILRGLSLTTGANQIGIDQQTTFNSDATTSGRGISSVVVTKAASFTMANGVAFYALTPVLGAGSAITTNTGLYVANQGSTGITNAYGIDIAAQSGAATTNVAIRAAGKIMFTSLPTSSVGLASGELWNDSGTVKIA